VRRRPLGRIAQLGQRPRHGAIEAFALDGLEQVVEGMHLEGIDRVVRERRDEDHERRAVEPGALDDLETVGVGHLDV
jgi:hypothetical protein